MLPRTFIPISHLVKLSLPNILFSPTRGIGLSPGQAVISEVLLPISKVNASPSKNMRNYAKRLFTDRDTINCTSKYTPSKYFQHITSVLINSIDSFPSSCVHEVQAKSKRFVPIPVTLDIYRNWNHETIMYRRRMVENPDLNSRVFLMRSS